jgi:hypothetical protein
VERPVAREGLEPLGRGIALGEAVAEPPELEDVPYELAEALLGQDLAALPVPDPELGPRRAEREELLLELPLVQQVFSVFPRFSLKSGGWPM